MKIKRKKTGVFLALFIFSLYFNSCSRYNSEIPADKKGELKIICGSPSITEIVFSLGLGDHVVGVSDYSVYPPEAKNRSKIGGLFNPNRERIISIQPDLLITQGKHAVLSRLCRDQGIKLLSVTLDSLADIPAAILLLGQELNAKEQARRLVLTLQHELDSVKALTSTRPKRKVFITLGHTPGDLTGLMTSGKGTFLHELLEIAGGENIFSDAPGLYPHISKEALVMRQPEIILEVFPEGISEGNRALLRQDWVRMTTLPAVKNGRIFYLTDDYLLIPGVRIGRTARKFAEIFHPEIEAKKK